jgi:hypothetical protein
MPNLQISPHLNLLMEILPRLWTSAQDDDNFKMSIVVTLKKLVEALKSDSQVLHGPICQFIQISCDPASVRVDTSFCLAIG